MRRWIFLVGSLLIIILPIMAIAIICAQAGNERKLGIYDLHQRIEIGMSRERVEAILGPPQWTQDDGPGADLRVGYLGKEYAERSLLPHESPMSVIPAGIFVSYRHGRLVEKSYNSQWLNERPRPWWRFW